MSNSGDIELGIGTEGGHVGVQLRYQVGGQKVGNDGISLGGQILNGRGRQAWYRGAAAGGSVWLFALSGALWVQSINVEGAQNEDSNADLRKQHSTNTLCSIVSYVF